MIGAGVFSAIGPAAQAAGPGLLIGLAVASFIAYCNATSSAQLAALYPESGGAYVYGRRRLGSFWGFLAGWAFVIGKLGSCMTMALTFAEYSVPEFKRPMAVLAALSLTLVNYLGVRKTALLTRILVAAVLLALGLVVMAILSGGNLDPQRLRPIAEKGPYGILQSGAILFFAFAGYARIATMGEEIRDPARTIPQAMPWTLGLTLLVYGAVAISALLGLGADGLANADAPLAAAVSAGRWRALVPVVRVGAAIASLSVLLSLLVGLSRTVFAMSGNGDLPGYFAAVHPRRKVPHRAEIVVGLLVAIGLIWFDLRAALGLSSFAVLLYYSIANLSSLTLKPAQRSWPRWLGMAGVVGCLLLAFSLPVSQILKGVVLVGAGAIVQGIRFLLLNSRD